MRNPIKNAWQSLLHNKRHLVFAIYRRLPWLILDDKLYLRIYYRLSLKKKLNLDNPKDYNEKLQWLKLYDRRPEYVQMVDKFLVKSFVADLIGEKYVIPTLGMWRRPKDIEWDKLPNQFVLKTNHDGGGNGIVVCKNKDLLNKRKALKELRHSFYRNTYMIGREWPYKMINRCVFAEQFMQDRFGELRDYKFYCFDGVAKVMLIASERGTGNTKMNYYDMDFNLLDLHQGHEHIVKVEKPKSFDEMKQIAEKLSKGLPQCRVDLYEVNNQPYFGEITFFDSGGTGAFYPEEWDRIFGDWITLPEKHKN